MFSKDDCFAMKAFGVDLCIIQDFCQHVLLAHNNRI